MAAVTICSYFGAHENKVYHCFLVSPCLLIQSCPTLCDSMDCSPPDSSVHGIFQAKILKWVSISSSRGSCWPRDWNQVSSVSRIRGKFFTAEPSWKPIYLSYFNLHFFDMRCLASFCMFICHLYIFFSEVSFQFLSHLQMIQFFNLIFKFFLLLNFKNVKDSLYILIKVIYQMCLLQIFSLSL